MARPIKQGLDYFPVVCQFDSKMELLIAEYRSKAVGVVVGLYQIIYGNGYFVEWNDDSLMLFARKINEEVDTVSEIINKCFDRDIFSKKLFNEFGILTSTGIQKQYLQICKESKRKQVKFIKEYCLVEDSEFISVITEFIIIKSGLFAINDSDNTQSKEKESKEKESKEKEIESKEKETSSPSGDVQEPKKDFMDEVLEIWAEEYRASRNNNYEFINKGKDREGAGKLVAFIKRKHKEKFGSDPPREELLGKVKLTYKHALQIDDKYFRDNLTPMLLVSKLNEIINKINSGNGKGRSRTTDEDLKRIIEEELNTN